MKSSISKKTYKAIYRLLNRVSPIDGDCGRLCGSICCTCDADDAGDKGFSMGIYLLPGEDRVFTRTEDWLEWSYTKVSEADFPDSWSGIAYFVRCKTPPLCPRETRPLQCRVFPLAPHITGSGELRMILFPAEGLPYRCPLAENEAPLSPAFVKATNTVWKRLIQDRHIYDLVKYDSDFRDEKSLVFLP
ncbi:MAG: hypothetical protein LBG71_05645 [Clostridiales Family XIII bacterium]|jgi:hypothetical protein|nr:hypothetical protein [Clostridiales Family XIII bacterium]